MQQLINNLKRETKKVKLGGGQAAYERHTSKGKLSVRERVDLLLDPGAPFLELSPLAAHDMYTPENIVSAGIVCGVGRVSG